MGKRGASHRAPARESEVTPHELPILYQLTGAFEPRMTIWDLRRHNSQLKPPPRPRLTATDHDAVNRMVDEAGFGPKPLQSGQRKIPPAFQIIASANDYSMLG